MWLPWPIRALARLVARQKCAPLQPAQAPRTRERPFTDSIQRYPSPQGRCARVNNLHTVRAGTSLPVCARAGWRGACIFFPPCWTRANTRSWAHYCESAFLNIHDWVRSCGISLFAGGGRGASTGTFQGGADSRQRGRRWTIGCTSSTSRPRRPRCRCATARAPAHKRRTSPFHRDVRLQAQQRPRPG